MPETSSQIANKDVAQALRRVQSLAEAGDREGFVAALAGARAAADAAPPGGQRDAARDALRVEADIDRIWSFSLDSTTGAFLDESVDGGALLAMLRQYPDYARSIADATLVVGDRTMYPSRESRQFLIEQAASKLRRLGIHSASRQPRVPVEGPSVSQPRETELPSAQGEMREESARSPREPAVPATAASRRRRSHSIAAAPQAARSATSHSTKPTTVSRSSTRSAPAHRHEDRAHVRPPATPPHVASQPGSASRPPRAAAIAASGSERTRRVPSAKPESTAPAAAAWESATPKKAPAASAPPARVVVSTPAPQPQQPRSQAASAPPSSPRIMPPTTAPFAASSPKIAATTPLKRPVVVNRGIPISSTSTARQAGETVPHQQAKPAVPVPAAKSAPLVATAPPKKEPAISASPAARVAVATPIARPLQPPPPPGSVPPSLPTPPATQTTGGPTATTTGVGSVVSPTYSERAVSTSIAVGTTAPGGSSAKAGEENESRSQPSTTVGERVGSTAAGLNLVFAGILVIVGIGLLVVFLRSD